MKILLVGEMGPGSSVGFMYKNLAAQGVETELIDTHRYFAVSSLNKIINKFLPAPYFFGRAVGDLNALVYARARAGGYPCVLFMKPILIFPETVAELKKTAKVFSWYPDNVDFMKSGSTYFYKSIPLFDCHFSAIRANTEALLRHGAKRAIYLLISADPNCHHPVPVSNEERKKLGADIVFIGTYAKERRAEYLERLCRDGYDVKIYGNGWQKLPRNSCLRRKKRIVPGGVYCEDMAKVLGASKIALNFMREHNKETIACRSWEIPLCGGFMLHEATDEAKTFFAPDKETVFFNSYEDMKRKIDFYLRYPKERETIARAGRERVLHSGWLIDGVVKRLLEILRNEFELQ